MNKVITAILQGLLYTIATGSSVLGSGRNKLSEFAASEDRGQLGIFIVLVFGAVALVVVSIVLLFGMQIAGGFSPDGVSETETFDFAATGEQTYTVERTPADEDVTALGDQTTVTEDGVELEEGTDYEWNSDTGEVTILNADDTATYEITYEVFTGTYDDTSLTTVDSTGDAFELFGTSVLVIPAAAVLAVLIGGLVGAISMRGAMPGMNGGGDNQIQRRGR